MKTPSPVIERCIRQADRVVRWQVCRVSRQQMVAGHSWMVSVYAMRVAEMLMWEGDWRALMREALCHDLDEVVTGDIPGPFKNYLYGAGAKGIIDDFRTREMSRRIPWAAYQTTDEVARGIVHLADYMERVLYASEEVHAGNSDMRALLPSLVDAALEAARRFDREIGGPRGRLTGDGTLRGWYPGWATELVNNSLRAEAAPEFTLEESQGGEGRRADACPMCGGSVQHTLTWSGCMFCSWTSSTTEEEEAVAEPVPNRGNGWRDGGPK